MVNISDRPVQARDRAVPGFWEVDLIIGKGGRSRIATLVERSTRYTMLVRIPYDRTADRVAIVLAQKMATLPGFLRNSITWDQGKELAVGCPAFLGQWIQSLHLDERQTGESSKEGVQSGVP